MRDSQLPVRFWAGPQSGMHGRMNLKNLPKKLIAKRKLANDDTNRNYMLFMPSSWARFF